MQNEMKGKKNYLFHMCGWWSEPLPCGVGDEPKDSSHQKGLNVEQKCTGVGERDRHSLCTNYQLRRSSRCVKNGPDKLEQERDSSFGRV